MRVLVAVPVYNEQQHVAAILPAIRRHVRDLLVIDDGSTDGTAGILKRCKHIAVLTHPENRGYGQSLIDAFSYAACHGYDWVITMDCDGQHEPDQLPDFLAAIQRDDADVISGSRYLPASGQSGAAPADRRNINRLLTELLNAMLTLRLTDSFCGYKAYRVAALERLSLSISGYAFPMQFWAQAAAAGLRITELPVRLIYNDPNRHFGGELDNPAARLAHYIEVLSAELQAVRSAPVAARQKSCRGKPDAVAGSWDGEWQHLWVDH